MRLGYSRVVIPEKLSILTFLANSYLNFTSHPPVKYIFNFLKLNLPIRSWSFIYASQNLDRGPVGLEIGKKLPKFIKNRENRDFRPLVTFSILMTVTQFDLIYTP